MIAERTWRLVNENFRSSSSAHRSRWNDLSSFLICIYFLRIFDSCVDSSLRICGTRPLPGSSPSSSPPNLDSAQLSSSYHRMYFLQFFNYLYYKRVDSLSHGHSVSSTSHLYFRETLYIFLFSYFVFNCINTYRFVREHIRSEQGRSLARSCKPVVFTIVHTCIHTYKQFYADTPVKTKRKSVKQDFSHRLGKK